MIREDYYDLATYRKVRRRIRRTAHNVKRRIRRTAHKVKIKSARTSVRYLDAKGSNILKTRRYKARILLTNNL